MQRWQEPLYEIMLPKSWQQFGIPGHTAVALAPVPAGRGGTDVNIQVRPAFSVSPQPEKIGELSLRLWLQSPCGTENLWFLNTEHLLFVKAYLQASLNPELLHLAQEEPIKGCSG